MSAWRVELDKYIYALRDKSRLVAVCSEHSSGTSADVIEART